MSSPSTPLRAAPIVADRYEIQGKLGSGGLGTVYRVWDALEKRQVALKVLRAERLLEDSISKMQREFQLIASLRHPRIAKAYDFGYLEPVHVPYYTREYISGEPVSSTKYQVPSTKYQRLT